MKFEDELTVDMKALSSLYRNTYKRMIWSWKTSFKTKLFGIRSLRALKRMEADHGQ